MEPKQGSEIILQSKARVASFDQTLPRDLLDLLWKRPKAVLKLGEVIRKSMARSTVRVAWGSNQYILKHYIEPTPLHAAKRAVQCSRARATWLAAQRLADAEIATPRPVACIENRWAWLQRDSFLMYPYVEGRTLRSCFHEQLARDPSLMVSLGTQLQGLWRQLVEIRASLGDTNVGNFIVSSSNRLWVVDLDKTRFHWLGYLADRHRERGWRQFKRSALAAGGCGVQFVEMFCQ